MPKKSDVETKEKTPEEIAAELPEEVRNAVLTSWLGGIPPQYWKTVGYTSITVDIVRLHNDLQWTFMRFLNERPPFKALIVPK